MTWKPHLTEDERHEFADGSLAPEQSAAVEAHLRGCAECSADVERIRVLMKRVDDSTSRPAAVAGVEELWPSIRDRIEGRKVVAMPGAAEPTGGTKSRSLASLRMTRLGIGVLAAAGIVAMWVVNRRTTPVESTNVAQVTDSGVSLIAVVDSTHAYQEEAQELLNHLELERAALRPEISRALDRDLRAIDVAIAELQEAIRTDPANPALRRLLASSFRQKVDLLKRVTNAG